MHFSIQPILFLLVFLSSTIFCSELKSSSEHARGHRIIPRSVAASNSKITTTPTKTKSVPVSSANSSVVDWKNIGHNASSTPSTTDRNVNSPITASSESPSTSQQIPTDNTNTQNFGGQHNPSDTNGTDDDNGNGDSNHDSNDGSGNVDSNSDQDNDGDDDDDDDDDGSSDTNAPSGGDSEGRPAMTTTAGDAANKRNESEAVAGSISNRNLGIGLGVGIGCVAVIGLAGLLVHNRRRQQRAASSLDENVNTRWRPQSFLGVVASVVAKLPRTPSQRSQGSASSATHFRAATGTAIGSGYGAVEHPSPDPSLPDQHGYFSQPPPLSRLDDHAQPQMQETRY
ncbi:uncharacterized protein BYT42DRAFT_603257 [Radiomyces spectabilis]|uniref:uncharacterized protein n=1 Tax=Radiomyces spectabilis TaxID=64574 RepID=UPI0022206966|nr:uncharacterized protein BYT42DRAFT_603257 [Radiomyces spectabilis]KAI8388830.1 hypothetical protein BYT42DRAFT_603257 [Radiomyces spectabilis]